MEIWSLDPAAVGAGASHFSLLASGYSPVNEGPGEDAFQESYML